MTNQEEAKLTRAQIEQFTRHWSEFDPKATMLIPTTQLPALFAHLPQPLGFPPLDRIQPDRLDVLIGAGALRV